jgi:hypothetical protein
VRVDSAPTRRLANLSDSRDRNRLWGMHARCFQVTSTPTICRVLA